MTSIADVLGGRYRLVRLLGRGGMSDVYEAVDERDGTSVALKIVRSGDPEFVRRLTLEAQALERFEHPGLIRLLDTGLAGDDAYLVMQFVDGPTLAESLQKGSLSAPTTAALGARMADALAYVHSQGVVHRDVKPSNILINRRGEPILTDFGLARLGTPAYMPPEEMRDEPAGDVYSLGVVLYESLTGLLASDETASKIDPRLDSICQRAMAKDVAARYPDMTAFAAALAPFAEHFGPIPFGG